MTADKKSIDLIKMAILAFDWTTPIHHTSNKFGATSGLHWHAIVGVCRQE